MTQVRIKITTGNTTVEVEAPVEEIEETVKKVLSALKTAEPAPQIKTLQARKTITCRKAVEELVQTGWMRTGKSLSEVAAELQRRGFNYDTTAIAHVLLDMVRTGVLERVGEPRRYIYVESPARKELSLEPSQEVERSSNL